MTLFSNISLRWHSQDKFMNLVFCIKRKLLHFYIWQFYLYLTTYNQMCIQITARVDLHRPQNNHIFSSEIECISEHISSQFWCDFYENQWRIWTILVNLNTFSISYFSIALKHISRLYRACRVSAWNIDHIPCFDKMHFVMPSKSDTLSI